MSHVTNQQREIDLKQRATRQGYKHPRGSTRTDCSAIKSKTAKRNPRETPGAPLDPYEEFGDSSPPNLSVMIHSEDDDSRIMDWVEALYANDKSGGENVAPLVELLRSTNATRDLLLADWIERYDHAKKVGRPRLPIYRMTAEDKMLHNASCCVKELRAVGLSFTDAFDRVAADLDNAAIDSLVLDGWSVSGAVRRVFSEPDIITETKLDDFNASRRRSVRKKK